MCIAILKITLSEAILTPTHPLQRFHDDIHFIVNNNNYNIDNNDNNSSSNKTTTTVIIIITGKDDNCDELQFEVARRRVSRSPLKLRWSYQV